MTQTLSSPPSLGAVLSRSQGPFLDLDRDAFLPCFNARACFVRHRLTDHPLFDLPRLFQLARDLPAKYVRINSGAVAVNATPAEIPGTGLSTEDSFRRIEDTNTRIMLKHIELDREYRDLLHACLGELEALGHPATRAVRSRVGYVFISAPNQTTPYHMDPEINFLLQVRGRKTFHVLPGDDRSILSEEDIERFYSGNHKSLPFKEAWKGHAVPFEMAPGDGVHIPVNHPHWVTTDNEVTISFALTSETAATQRRGVIHAVNHHLRQRGFKPTPFGQSPVRDFFKYQGYRLWHGLSSLYPRRGQESTH
jgi:Cupin-like domain